MLLSVVVPTDRGRIQRVLAVLEGFAVLGILVALGALLARVGILDAPAERLLNTLAFYVALPPLMVQMLAPADLANLFSANLATALLSALVAGATYLLVVRLVWPTRTRGERTVGTFASAYANSGYLGIPISTFALGSAAWVAPTLLMQTLLLQPVALAVLDSAVPGRSRRTQWRAILTNPVTISAVVAVLVNVTEVELPGVVARPMDMLAATCVPLMLLGFGSSLVTGPKVGSAAVLPEVSVVAVCKQLVQPLAALALGSLIFGLSGVPLLAVVVCAALPTAQNTAVHASRYGVAQVLARDSIVVTTALSVPVVLGLVAWLG